MTPSTKQALAASLKKLLRRKFLDDITVKEIVADCTVNRQTFYYHFQDIYDLLHFLLEEETGAVLADCSSWQESLLRAFQYIQDEHTMVYHVFLSDGREHLDCQVYALARRIVEDELTRCAGDLLLAEEDRSFLVRFYMHALAGMMIGWHEKRNVFLALVGLIYQKFKRMWVYRSSSYVAKGEVFPGNC